MFLKFNIYNLNYLLRGYFWDLAGKFANQLVSFILGIIIARLLSPGEYGLVGMSMVFISISGIFVNFGLSSALIQRKEVDSSHYSSAFFLNFAIATIFSILIFSLSSSIAFFFKTPDITPLIRVLSLNLIISSLTIVPEIRLIKELNFKKIAEIGLLSSIISGFFALLLAWKGFGVWSLVAQTLISSLLRLVLVFIYSKWIPSLIFSFYSIKELWKYGVNLFFSGVLNVVFEQLDTIIIARIFSSVDLGLYSRAKSLNRFVIKFTSESIGNVTFPAMSKLNNDKTKMIEMGIKAESLIAFLAFGLLGWLFVTAESLFLILFGEKWINAIPIYKLLCLSGFVYPVSAATLTMLKASGDSKTFLKIEVYKKIISLFSISIGFYFGLTGFLYSLILSGFVSTVLNMYYTAKSLKISFSHQFTNSFKYTLPAFLAVYLSSFLDNLIVSHILNLFLLSGIFIFTYLIMNYLIKTEGFFLVYYKFKNIFFKV